MDSGGVARGIVGHDIGDCISCCLHGRNGGFEGHDASTASVLAGDPDLEQKTDRSAVCRGRSSPEDGRKPDHREGGTVPPHAPSSPNQPRIDEAEMFRR